MGSDGWYLTTDPENLIDPDKKYVSLPAAGPGQIASYEVLQKDRDTSYTFENGILTIHKGTFTGNDYAHNSFMAAVIKMAGNKLNIKKLVAEKDVIFTDSCSYLFQSFENAEEIDLSQADMTEVTYANNMFSICPSLRSVKMGKTSNKLINISDIFENLNNLQTVDLSNLDTSGVTSMNGMFRYCNSLKSVDLSNLSLRYMSMQKMFKGCTALERIVLGDPTSTTTQNYYSSYFTEMFDGDERLTELTVPKTMYVPSEARLVNNDFNHTGWYNASDPDKKIVSGTNEYAYIGKNTNETIVYKRDPIVYDSCKVKNASLTLQGEIGLNFYAAFPDSVLKNENAYVVMEDPKGKKQVKISDAVYDKINGYKFTYMLAAKHIHEKVSFKVYDGINEDPIELKNANDETQADNSYSYAVIDYINYVKANLTNNLLLKLVKSLEVYGTYAMKYFNYKTDTIPQLEANLDSTMVNTVNNVSYNTVQNYKFVKPNYPEGLKLTGYSLVLESVTTMKLYFESDDIEKYRFESAGKEFTPKKLSGNKYVIEIKSNSAKEDSQSRFMYMKVIQASISSISISLHEHMFIQYFISLTQAQMKMTESLKYL